MGVGTGDWSIGFCVGVNLNGITLNNRDFRCGLHVVVQVGGKKYWFICEF